MLEIAEKSNGALIDQFEKTRSASLALISDLHPEDTVVQSMPDVSPTKWHLAHVTWFFERFVLEPSGVERYRDDFHYLFNSYYNSVGEMHPRSSRGLLSRPTLAEILDYRARINDRVVELLHADRISEDAMKTLVLGLHHEQQHQELLLTDIKHVLSCNPMRPAARNDLRQSAGATAPAHDFARGETGILRIGHSADDFCFDNETPAHNALLHPHSMGNRLITNGEFREFIKAGAYDEPAHWLSDGWATARKNDWRRPLYWDEALETEFTLAGQREIDEHAPVTHVSYYEADAFARWSGHRLPTEFEWERAAIREDNDGNLLGSEFWQPVATDDSRQFIGDVWEWTSSAYSPYPGFRPLDGSLGEYNGKFMSNQMTVRGGSCVTANDHIRASYRSFFYPDARWQFLGFRLAKDENA